MKELIRDSSFGQLLRSVTRNKILQYHDESSNFTCPACYAGGHSNEIEKSPTTDPSPTPPVNGYGQSPPEQIESRFEEPSSDLATTSGSGDEDVERRDSANGPANPNGLWKIPTNAEIKRTYTQQAQAERAVSRPVFPVKTSDGTILVDWWTTDDPENPQNWSWTKKNFVSAQICIYSFAVYVGSSIYSPTVPQIEEAFKVSGVTASVGLAIYVLAYGIGPMLFSPLSEIPAVGRNPIYIATFVIFVILQVPTALVDNFAGLLVLRCLSGFFGSPCLATGAATFQDMYPFIKIPYLLALWAGSVTMGPALAPIIAGFSVGPMGWHWFAWELLWLAAPICLLMFICLPETSTPNILFRRAQRLRKSTGRHNLKSQSQIDQADMSVSDIAFEALVKPWQINVLDPAVAFTTLYTALVYGLFYSFFESFPLVYPVKYHFNLGESSLPFLAIVVGLLICIPLYCAYYYYIIEPRVKLSGFGPPEDRLKPGLICTFFVPIGMFIFGWSARESCHWIGTVFGVGVTMIGCYIIIQSLFLYLPFTYPQYAASLFAANDFARSSFAAGCVVFAGPMFNDLGVAKGCTLLAGLSIGCTAGIYVLYYFGANLRARSRFAVK